MYWEYLNHKVMISDLVSILSRRLKEEKNFTYNINQKTKRKFCQMQMPVEQIIREFHGRNVAVLVRKASNCLVAPPLGP